MVFETALSQNSASNTLVSLHVLNGNACLNLTEPNHMLKKRR